MRSYLRVIDIDTQEIETLYECDKLIEAPNWTRDGKALIYNSMGRLYRFDLKTEITNIINTEFANRCNNDHVLSNDGKWIALSHNALEDGDSRIYIVPIDGGKPKLITPVGPSYLHGWSPDQSTLAYCACRDGQYDIYTVLADGGEERQLTNTIGLDDGPEYSPCGQYIWFNSVRSGLMQIYRMDKDGNDVCQMTRDDANNWFPHVSPNGKHVTYITYRKGDVNPGDHPANKEVSIGMMNSDGTHHKTLVELFGGQGSLNVNSWSPCSQKIAFVSYEL